MSCRKASGGFCFYFMVFWLIGILGAVQPLHGQCSTFARGVVKPELAPFLHDGNLNATILAEGERIVLQKTVFDGLKYRIVVMGVPDLPSPRFKLKDGSGDILFDNIEYDYASKWDFDVQTTQNLFVEITVPEDDDPSADTGGCVAVLFGIERE